MSFGHLGSYVWKLSKMERQDWKSITVFFLAPVWKVPIV